jgi:hypothetical protein
MLYEGKTPAVELTGTLAFTAGSGVGVALSVGSVLVVLVEVAFPALVELAR